MQGIPPIKAVMTPFPYSIGRGEPILAARDMMRLHAIRHLPVMEDNHLIGVVTDRDIQLFLGRIGGSAEEQRVGDVYSTKVYVVPLTQPLDRVLLHMAEHHIDAALVTKDGRLAGIFTVTDACRRFGEMLRSLYPSGEDQEPA